MKGLLIKDLKLMKNMLKLVSVIIIFSVVFSTIGENLFFSMGYVSVFVSILSITSISYDEYDNGMAYLFSLPFARKEYVKEKYVLALGLIVTGILVSGVISYVISRVMEVTVTSEEWFAVIISSVSVALILISAVLPTQLKYGSEKGRIAMIVVFLGMAILGFGVYWISEQLGFDIESKLDVLFYSPVKMGVSAGVISALAFIGSYLLSVKVIEKKEF